MHIPLIVEVGVLSYPFCNCRGKRIGGGIIESHANVLYFHVDGKAKQQDLHHGHSQDYQQSPVVHADVAELFFYKCVNCFII